jgi:hypothetical protein
MINIDIKCNSENLTISNIMSLISHSVINQVCKIEYNNRNYEIKSNCTETYINYIIKEIK